MMSLRKRAFRIGNLLGKLLFVDDDVRAGAKLPDGSLKKISEAKLLSVRIRTLYGTCAPW